jgi:hypothetical protein
LASLREPFVLTELDSCTADCLSALSCTETKGVAGKGWEAPKITRASAAGDDGFSEQVLPTAFIRSLNLQPREVHAPRRVRARVSLGAQPNRAR